MSAGASYALSTDFGALASESDRRFKRLLGILAIPAIIFGIVVPFIEIAGLLHPDLVNPQRYAKLIKKVEEKKKEEPPKPKPPELTKEQKVERAKAKAEKRLAVLRDSLADLRQANLPTLNQPLMASNVITSSANTNTFASSAAKGSGGIGEVGVVARGSTTGLGSRSGTSVKSGIGGNGEKGFGGKAGRTLEEIQLVFDRNKGALYTMYVRETRNNPDMSGKLTVRMTIAPSGRVTKCSVIASELHNKEFEDKVVARILLMDFGAKDVGDFTLDYPINFFPTS